jgi:hypothetical protein
MAILGSSFGFAISGMPNSRWATAIFRYKSKLLLFVKEAVSSCKGFKGYACVLLF